MEQFNFLSEAYYYALRQLGRESPFLALMYAVYAVPSQPLKGLISKKNEDKNHLIESLDIEDAIPEFIPLRERKRLQLQWFSPEELSVFPYRKTDIYTKGIFEENEKSILMVPYKSRVDQKWDLFFLFFDRNRLDFGMHPDKKALNTSEKQLLEITFKHKIQVTLDDYHKHRRILEKYRKHQHFLVKQVEKKSKAQRREEEKLKDLLHYLVEETIAGLEKGSGTKIVLTDELKAKCFMFSERPRLLKKKLREAVERASAYCLPGEDIVLYDWYLEDDESAVIHDDEVRVNDREQVIYELLEDVKQSVVKLKKMNQKVIAINVIEHMNHKMTPQAITDYFKRYSDEIVRLHDRNPGHWKILRDNFRPYFNVVD